MPNLAIDKVEVYVFRRRSPKSVEFLALRRAPARSLPGVWQPVTGKIELFETPAEAAFREVHEETGLTPRGLWRLELTTLCLDPRGRSLMALPLLAAEVGAREAVTLSKEHDAAKFVSATQASRLYLWDSQRQGLAAVSRQILRGGRLANALELPLPVAPAPERSSPRARKRTSTSNPRR